MIKETEDQKSQQGMLDLVYQQRNDRDEFLQTGKYKQMEAEEVSFSENDVNKAVESRESDDSDDYSSGEDEVKFDKDIYKCDSDHGNTCICKKDAGNPRNANQRMYRKRKEERKREELRERRKTLPSENFHIPTSSGWE